MTAQHLGHDGDDLKKVSCDNAQMSLNHRIARSHLESLIEELTGVDKAVPDRDGDYLINTQSSGFFARVEGNEPATFRLFSVIVADIQASAELYETVNEINTRLNFLRAMYVGEQVLIEGDLLAMTASPQDFREVCSRIAHASDYFGPEILTRFGGRPFFEESKAPDYAAPAPHLPGYL